jgi:hypothetical protein
MTLVAESTCAVPLRTPFKGTQALCRYAFLIVSIPDFLKRCCLLMHNLFVFDVVPKNFRCSNTFSLADASSAINYTAPATACCSPMLLHAPLADECSYGCSSCYCSHLHADDCSMLMLLPFVFLFAACYCTTFMLLFVRTNAIVFSCC